MLRSCAVLSKYCSASSRLTNAHPSVQTVRFLRTKQGQSDDPKDKGEKSEAAKDPKPEEEDPIMRKLGEFLKNNPELKEKMKIDPNQAFTANPNILRRLFTIGVVSFGAALVVSYLTFKMGGVQAKKLMGKEVSFDEFIEKYLSAGEVKSITYIPAQHVALAELHQGAIIDGVPFTEAAVLVKYNRVDVGLPDQFLLDIKHAEQKLGVSYNSVPISVIQSGPSAFKMIEFGFGVGIIVALLLAYARVAARRLAVKGMPKPPSQSSNKD